MRIVSWQIGVRRPLCFTLLTGGVANSVAPLSASWMLQPAAAMLVIVIVSPSRLSTTLSHSLAQAQARQSTEQLPAKRSTATLGKQLTEEKSNA